MKKNGLAWEMLDTDKHGFTRIIYRFMGWLGRSPPSRGQVRGLGVDGLKGFGYYVRMKSGTK